MSEPFPADKFVDFEKFSSAIERVEKARDKRGLGKVTQVIGGVIKASVPEGFLGEVCSIRTNGRPTAYAEIIGFTDGIALLAPYSDITGIGVDSVVAGSGKAHGIAVSDDMLGHVYDGMGRPLDGSAPIEQGSSEFYLVDNDAPSAMGRSKVDSVFSFGIKAIDGLLTCAEGQRLGIFAAAGGGKSTLLGMMVRFSEADVVVVGLIGERGREVKEFIEDELGPDGMKKSVIVVATSDRPAAERVKAALVATTISEYFRDQGLRVLLLMDSLTRYARAQREIGLAAGEAPTRRGFPASVFALLPRLLERSGNNERGSTTAMYTVLVEGDDMTEPVADEAKSILDGHIILSQKLAEKNHYPAIDVLNSASRVMGKVVAPEVLKNASYLKTLLAKYDEIDLLVKVGEYKEGVDAVADEAVQRIDRLHEFMKQDIDTCYTYANTVSELAVCLGEKQ